MTIARRIKRLKRELGDEGYRSIDVRKGFFKIDGKEVIYPVLWCWHERLLDDYGGRLRKTVVVAPPRGLSNESIQM